ncbi:hypothetical protein Glove_54g106 [Diversispora epigaea]|uniref:Uncharacterized protein n=1 Tax=Diversispora epigaea TaxID=1348612 RepID=A0A397JCL7_9GLOM|nr:hypothetical protein Glove_54g106 [Diversispora epigaea]
MESRTSSERKCSAEHFIQEFGTWSSGNIEINKVIQECQTNFGYNLQWIPYDYFQDKKNIVNSGYGSVHSTILKNVFWDCQKIADENQEKAIISQKPELSYPYISHSQSCYISRNIYTLHGLHNSLEDIKSGKSQESQECIGWEEEIQNRTRKRSFSTLDYTSDRGDNITKKKIADENQEKAIISQKPELSYPYISHSQSCYISRNIYTLHGLHNSLEDIKSGKSQESQECIGWEEEIQNRTRKRSFSTLDYTSDRGDNITKKKVKNAN